ncbi:unnamed protein product [Moneuplotes crassus]|uniref:Cyclic nucleotide-binding domain-containing protein n=2 Tax=Euplotes crassus TaxID=5936 RepID=A0AAD1XXX1_EUPCR|nr:unnamed protein product [Moneuplotes crassus]
MNRASFEKVMMIIKRRENDIIVKFLERYRYIYPLTYQTKIKLGYFLKEIECVIGQEIYKEGDDSNYIYLIKSGEFEIQKNMYTCKDPERTISFLKFTQMWSSILHKKKNPDLLGMINERTQICFTEDQDHLENLKYQVKDATIQKIRVAVKAQGEQFGANDCYFGCPYRTQSVKCVSPKGVIYQIDSKVLIQRVKQNNKDLKDIIMGNINLVERQIQNFAKVKKTEIYPAYFSNNLVEYEASSLNESSERDPCTPKSMRSNCSSLKKISTFTDKSSKQIPILSKAPKHSSLCKLHSLSPELANEKEEVKPLEYSEIRSEISFSEDNEGENSPNSKLNTNSVEGSLRAKMQIRPSNIEISERQLDFLIHNYRSSNDRKHSMYRLHKNVKGTKKSLGALNIPNMDKSKSTFLNNIESLKINKNFMLDFDSKDPTSLVSESITSEESYFIKINQEEPDKSRRIQSGSKSTSNKRNLNKSSKVNSIIQDRSGFSSEKLNSPLEQENASLGRHSQSKFNPNSITDKGNSNKSESETEKPLSFDLKEHTVEDLTELPEELRDIVPMKSILVTSLQNTNEMLDSTKEERQRWKGVIQPILIKQSEVHTNFPTSSSVKNFYRTPRRQIKANQCLRGNKVPLFSTLNMNSRNSNMSSIGGSQRLLSPLQSINTKFVMNKKEKIKSPVPKLNEKIFPINKTNEILMNSQKDYSLPASPRTLIQKKNKSMKNTDSVEATQNIPDSTKEIQTKCKNYNSNCEIVNNTAKRGKINTKAPAEFHYTPGHVFKQPIVKFQYKKEEVGYNLPHIVMPKPSFETLQELNFTSPKPRKIQQSILQADKCGFSKSNFSSRMKSNHDKFFIFNHTSSKSLSAGKKKLKSKKQVVKDTKTPIKKHLLPLFKTKSQTKKGFTLNSLFKAKKQDSESLEEITQIRQKCAKFMKNNQN